ncbi:MAG: VanW family protein [Paludibacter sp.]|nr:VanW family protein [Paludibacter sp.]
MHYQQTEIQKPLVRNKFRQIAGREFYIIKRKINWVFSKKLWAKSEKEHSDWHSVFVHKSLILRPLRNVDMYLQENKRTNLKLAIAKLNNIVIAPKQTFSVWRNLGRPTKHKGYLDGLILNQGKVNKGTGGGLCQLGNLLFWIFAHSPLTVTERYRHGFDVFPDVNRNVPFGAGATLSYNYIDLQAINQTDNTFQIRLWLDDKYLNGELLAKFPVNETFDIKERNHFIKQEFWGGYSRHNQIFKIQTDVSGNISESLLVENHAIMMYEPFLTY